MPEGDLTQLVDAFFDTSVGPKTSSNSYMAICRSLACEPREVAFISDVSKELAVARGAGLQVLLSVRPGNPLQPDAHEFERMDWNA